MNLIEKLTGRIHIEDIYEILYYVQGSNQRKQELYKLIYHEDDNISYQALWVCSHFSIEENVWLCAKQQELIDEVIICTHPGKRRIFLNLLVRQPLSDPLRVDFLDFCMERMVSKQELPGVQSLCMKIAYELCRTVPELLQEFSMILDTMEPDLLPPSIRCARKNILKAMKKHSGIRITEYS